MSSTVSFPFIAKPWANFFSTGPFFSLSMLIRRTRPLIAVFSSAQDCLLGVTIVRPYQVNVVLRHQILRLGTSGLEKDLALDNKVDV